MREIVRDVGDPGEYALLGNNCQAYVEKVLTAYNRLRETIHNHRIFDSIGDEDL